MRQTSKQPIRFGSSMVEVVIASLLSGVVIVGALNVMGGAIKTRAAISTYREGPMLANELLTEIMSRSYVDPENSGTGAFLGIAGLETGETSVRSTFDDVDDYLNWNASPPVDSNDVPMTQYAGWRRAVLVTWSKANDGSFSFAPTGLTKIEVTVTAPDGMVTKRYGFRWKEGALEQQSAIDTEIVTWVGAELQIGTQGLARAGTNHINAPTN